MSDLLLSLMTNPEMHDKFKNLIAVCSLELLQLITERIARDRTLFIEISTNSVGSSSMRKLLRAIKDISNLFASLLIASCSSFYELMTSKAGQYVAIECFSATEKTKEAVWYSVLIRYAFDIARHEVGCAALNEFLDHAKGSTRNLLIDLTVLNSVCLAQDPYGNYVLQKVLDLRNPLVTAGICTMLSGSFERLSFQKFGSFVVEKCLESPVGVRYVLQDLVMSNNLLRLAKSQYGNYVIQRALRAARSYDSFFHNLLLAKLLHLGEALKFGYSRNIYSLIHSPH